MDLHRLVRLLTEALGPAATPERVERLAVDLLDGALADSPRLTGAEPLAVRAVTLGVSLRDCASRLPATVRARAYDKVRKVAGHHVRTVGEEAARYGVCVGEVGLAVTPVALVADGGAARDYVLLARVLDAAAEHVGAHAVGGFAALVESGMTPGDRAFLDALPDALATAPRVRAAVVCGSTAAGVHAAAAERVAHAAFVLAHRADGGPSACARLTARCNATRAADGPGGFHGPGEGDAAVTVALAGADVLARARLDAGPDAPFDAVLAALPGAAADAAHAATAFGRACADRLAERSGFAVRFGGVALSLPDAGDLAPGAAARALLGAALRRGAALAHAHVDEDAHAAGLLALPGDAPALTALLLDALVPAAAEGRARSVRLLIIPGARVGETADLPGVGRVRVRALPR